MRRSSFEPRRNGSSFRRGGLAMGGFVRWAPMLALSVTMLACAPKVSLRVSPQAVAELPLERKLTLLDAENALLAAADAKEAQEERVLLAADARRAANKRIRDAEDARERDRIAKDGPAVGDAAIREAEARKNFTEKDRDLQRELMKLAEADYMLADAKFEQARAAEVEGAALAGAQGVKLEDYAKQVAKLEQVRAERAAEAAKVRAKADEARAAWDSVRGELTRLSGGAQGSVWVQ